MENDAMTDTVDTAPAAATPGPASPSPSFGPQEGIKLTEEEKTVRDRTRLNKAWEPLRAAGSEACLPAQREFVRKLARDLDAEIHFAGEVMRPPPLSLNDLSVGFEADPSACVDCQEGRQKS
jgi:hypothetical protein